MTKKIPMKISWNSLKISIAGARLSHLVRKDRIWDHGSMVEQVRGVFLQLQNAKTNGNAESLKKYTTASGYKKLKNELDEWWLQIKIKENKKAELKEISVVDVTPAKHGHSDLFKALVKGCEVQVKDGTILNNDENNRFHEFSEQWFFVRHGDWWLLDTIKEK